VARTNLRLAAGAGVVATFLLVGGPVAATAIADPNGSGSHSGGSDTDGRSGSRDGGGDNSQGGNDSDGSRGGDDGFDRPTTRVGSGREPGDAPSIDRSDSNAGSGPDQTAGTPGSFEPPKVTFGNGRTPGVQHDDREPRWRGGVPAAEPPPPPPPPVYIAPAPSLVERLTAPPRMPQQLQVAPAASWTEPLFGLAGLLLIPAAGAILGHRQARAGQAAAELGRHP
jgi:hypothetical protein